MTDFNRGRPLVRASSASKISQANKPNNLQQRSQSTQLPHTPRPGDLLHRAIRNEQIRHSSTTALEVPRAVAPPLKNIQMVQDAPFRALNPASHKLSNRWGQFNLHDVQEKAKAANSSTVDNGTPHKRRVNISPMTQFKPHARTPKSGISPADQGLVETSQSGHSHPSSTLSFTEQVLDHSWKHMARSSKGGSHASMNTLVPMLRYDLDVNTSGEEEEPGAIDQENREEYRSLTTGDADDVEATDMLTIFDIAREIQNFQDLVARPKHQESSGVNRTTQKMLDFKQYQEELDALAVSYLLDHAVKIQNEALLSTWTSIRLRFSSHVVSDSRSNLRCSAGVLGSIQRQPLKGIGSTEASPVTRSEKDNFLNNMWAEELQEVFDGRLRLTLFGSYEDEDIYKGAAEMSQVALHALQSRSSSNTGS